MSRTMLLGIVQLAVAALILLGSLALVWSSCERWSGIAHLTTANALALSGASEGAQREARAAASSLPTEAAAVLPTIDLSSSEAAERLQRLAARCPRPERSVVEVAQALDQVLHGQTPPIMDGPDGALLTLTARLRAGAPAAQLPEMKEMGAAHLSVLEACFVQQWLAAFSGRQWPLAREAAGTLSVLMPTHPDAPALAIAAIVLAPDFDVERLRHAYRPGGDHARVLIFAQQLAEIMPERSDALMTCVLGLSPTGSVVQRLQAELSAMGDQGLSPSWVLHDCLRSHHPELAPQAIAHLPESQRQLEQNRIINQVGDVSMLIQLGATDATFAPRCSTPRARSQTISFMLSNQHGVVPQAHVEITINHLAVPAVDIHQVGPLYGVHTTRSGDFLFVVSSGDQVLYSGTLTL